jgi:hypothetical protein
MLILFVVNDVENMADFINDYRGSDRLVRIFLDQSLVIDVNIKFDLNHHCKFPEKINCNCEYCDSEIGRPALWLACFNGHLNVVRTLIEIGKADVNLSDHKNWTPLRIAILKKHIDIVKYLIEQANAIIDENRDLFVAIQIGSYDIVDYLLNKGCDPNTRLIDQGKNKVEKLVLLIIFFLYRFKLFTS